MANSVAGLFGLSPEELQVQLRKEALAQQQLRAQEIAGYGAGLGPFQGLVQSSARMGDALGGLAQGLFGEAPAQDPRMTRALAMQELTKAYGDKDISDPTVLKSLIGDLQKGGFTREAFSLLGTYEQLKGSGKESTNYMTKDGSPAIYKNGRYYDAEGNLLKPSDLRIIPKDSLGRIINTATAGEGAGAGDDQKSQAAKALAARREKEAKAQATATADPLAPKWDDDPATKAKKAQARAERDAEKAKELSAMGGIGTEMVAP